MGPLRTASPTTKGAIGTVDGAEPIPTLDGTASLSTAAMDDSEPQDGATRADDTPSQNTETPEPQDGTIREDGTINLSTTAWETSLAVPPRQDAEEVDARDADCPDQWIKRHKEMVRLTGRHPFNSEPPLHRLQAVGWVTPPALHVVRNHGAVPRLSWDSHRLKLLDFPQGPEELSMEELTSGKFGSLASIPVTFICAGNRRKEQNMTKKTIGFNWGCAAVGNSVWTGVRLCELLACLGISKVTRERRFVHFEGPLGELPQGTTGSYGTSIDLGWALDRGRDVLLAFKQNGERLTPDHGAPLRTLLPGCIGGRMIKWLCSMRVTDRPSENHYHFFDNRVLPPHVDAEIASEEGWWYKPEYIINHININSAMFEPRHNSYFILAKGQKTLKVAGYAYVGGGLKIIRAEISLDGGRSWELTDLTRPEDEIAAARGTDKHWCWSWWETEVDADRLSSVTEIMCRAVDSNQNMQPAELTWNVMGMMNNCLFRVKVHELQHSDLGTGFWFEHPTQPGNQPGGWMSDEAGMFNEVSAKEAAPGRTGVAPHRPAAAVWHNKDFLRQVTVATSVAPISRAPSRAASKESTTSTQARKSSPGQDGITMEQVQQHKNSTSSWIVVKDKVYDATPFLKEHPGGASSILLVAGQDATEDFEAVHSKKAWDLLEDYYFMGHLKKETEEAQPPLGWVASVRGLLRPLWSGDGRDSECFLDPTRLRKLRLTKKICSSHNTRIFRFALPRGIKRFGLPSGQHIYVQADIKGQKVMRPYTPITEDDSDHVDLLVKVYFKGTNARYPEGGFMSQYLDGLKVGATVMMKGPVGEITYHSKGSFSHNGEELHCHRINMIAGGTGLTPCYQVITTVLRDVEDRTQMCLLYGNMSPEDILLRKELEYLAAEHADRFRLWFTVDFVPEGENWDYGMGFVDAEMIGEHMFAPADDVATFMCGPPAMIKDACIPSLEELGHQASRVFSF